MDVGIMGAATASRLFEKEFEKIPSPENKEVSRSAFLDLEETLADLVESAERKIVAGNKAGVDLPKVILKDGKKMRLVSEETIRALLARPLPPPLRKYSPEFMREMGLNDKSIAIMLRGIQASQDIRDFEADVVEQYNAKGYAYREIPEGGFLSKDVDEELRLKALELN